MLGRGGIDLTKEDCLNRIYKIYCVVEKKLKNIEPEVEGEVNVDMDINIKAQAYQEIREIFDSLIREKEKRKEKKIKDGGNDGKE